MGCGVSKLEPGEGSAASDLRSVRRRRSDGPRARKNSIVSTTGLLHPEELDDVVGAPPAADGMATAAAPPRVEAKCVRQVVQGGEQQQKKKKRGGEEEDAEAAEKRKGGAGEGAAPKRAPCSRGPALADGRRARPGNDDDEEEFPGSPSFRVYFADSPRGFSDDDSVISAVSNVGKIRGKKCRPTRGDSMKSITSEESEGKLPKRSYKGRRFRGLKKGPAGAVYGLLNVRSCYTVQSAGCHQEITGVPPPSHDSSGRISSASSITTTITTTTTTVLSANNQCSFVSEKVA